MSRLRHVLLAVTFILAVTVVSLRLLSVGPFSPANGTLLLDSPGCFPKVVSVTTGHSVLVPDRESSPNSPISLSLPAGDYLVSCSNIAGTSGKKYTVVSAQTTNSPEAPPDVSP